MLHGQRYRVNFDTGDVIKLILMLSVYIVIIIQSFYCAILKKVCLEILKYQHPIKHEPSFGCTQKMFRTRLFSKQDIIIIPQIFIQIENIFAKRSQSRAVKLTDNHLN